MNQRGFATSILIYTILGIFIVVTATMMMSVRNSQSLNATVKEDIMNEDAELTANKIKIDDNSITRSYLTQSICQEYDYLYGYVNVQCALDYLYDTFNDPDE